MARKKKTVTDVDIIDIADKGNTIGRCPDGRIVIVKGPVPGDVVDVLLLRKKKSLWHGIPVNYKLESPYRQQPFCSHFGICGGCKWQHLTYEKQLFYKDKMVRDALMRIAKLESTTFFPIQGSDINQFYRNKLEFSFSNKRWITQEELESGVQFEHRNGLGFHAPGAFDKVVDVEKCFLQPDPSNEIRNFVRKISLENRWPFYDIRERQGWLRSMVVRNTIDGKVMVILSFFHDNEEDRNHIFNALIASFSSISSIYYCINDKMNDSLTDLEMIHSHGEKYLVETLGKVKFLIGPKSFFQTNTKQAERLYSIVQSFADIKATDTVYDLYCGIGSISLYVADQAKQVIGIEQIQEAIDDAIQNRTLNQMEDVHFYTGDVRDLFNENMISTHGHPDIVITDPPRAGMHKDVVDELLKAGPPKIVYVSCNPSTQARDLAILKQKYDITMSQPVDMFPHTHHVENVALLEIKNGSR